MPCPSEEKWIPSYIAVRSPTKETKSKGGEGQVLTAVGLNSISLWVCTIFRKLKDHVTELTADQKHGYRMLTQDRKSEL